MKVTVCELPNDPAALRRAWAELVAHVRAHDSDLVLLPEMPWSRWLPAHRQVVPARWQEAAAEHERRIARLDEELPDTAVVGTRPVVRDGERLNVAFLRSPGGTVRELHAKVHLPDEEGFWEASWYAPGAPSFEPVATDWGPLGVLICTELWFLEHARRYGERGVRLLLCPRATPRTTLEKWLVGGRAAGVVSGAWCLSSNLAGRTRDGGDFAGGGWIVEPEEGELLGVTSAASPFLTLEIDLAAADRAKSSYPRYVDAGNAVAPARAAASPPEDRAPPSHLHAFLDRALPRLAADERIVAVAAAGSLATGELDEFSDLDLVVAVEPSAYGQVMAEREKTAAALGTLLVSFTGEHVGEPRLLVCLYATSDGAEPLHVDLKFVTPEAAAERVEEQVILWQRDDRLRQAFRRSSPRYPPPDPQWIEDRIWPWVHYTAAKIGRGEVFETLDALATIRRLALGPLALAAADATPAGVRRLEQRAPAEAEALTRTVAAPEPRACLQALECTIEAYLSLRERLAPTTLRRRRAAEESVRRYVRGVAEHIGATRVPRAAEGSPTERTATAERIRPLVARAAGTDPSTPEEPVSDDPVIHLESAEFVEWGDGGRYQARIGRLSPAVGARLLGFNVAVLPPGKAAFPYHFHHGNEELFVILEGSGRVRLGGREFAVREGDLVFCPTGERGAHQIVNDSDAELRYLALSTTRSPELVEYPDSDKFGAFAGEPGQPPAFRAVARKADDVDYWEGEG